MDPVVLRLGIVDFDSSHSIEFTRRLNHVGVSPDQYVDGARVVMGAPGKSVMSPERVPIFTQQIAECGVELVDEPTQMIGQIDAVLVLSLCGRDHLKRVQPFLEAGVPAYVDKPFACSLSDATQIVRDAQDHDVLMFGTSALRYSAEVREFQKQSARFGRLHGVVTYGPAKRAEGNPGLFHYGIHATEILVSLMGPGCERVTSTHTDDAEVVTGLWNDGRIGTIRGNRVGSTAYGFTAFTENGVVNRFVSTASSYCHLCREIVKAFQSGQPAVPHDTTLNLVRFVLAALLSEERDGTPVRLDEVQ